MSSFFRKTKSKVPLISRLQERNCKEIPSLGNSEFLHIRYFLKTKRKPPEKLQNNVFSTKTKATCQNSVFFLLCYIAYRTTYYIYVTYNTTYDVTILTILLITLRYFQYYLLFFLLLLLLLSTQHIKRSTYKLYK